MAKKMLIDSTHPEETRVVVVNGNKVEEFDFDSSARSLITGNIYLAKVSRIEPSLQAAFVDYGGNRQGFLAFSEIHPDYYQIPQADREALMQEELERQREEAEEEEQDDDREETASEKSSGPRSKSRRSRRSSRTKTVAEDSHADAVVSEEVELSDEVAEAPQAQADSDEDAKKPRKSRTRRKKKTDTADEDATEVTEVLSDDVADAEDIKDLEALDGVEQSDAEGNDSDDDEENIAFLSDPREAAEEVETETDDVEEDIRPKPSKKRTARPHNRYKIQEVIKPRQILLVQVVKEERGNKGAALTTYISLPGRYCVLMPNTARGGGISRKIGNINDRKRLRSLAKGFNVPQGAGLIIRTAGAKQDAEEIERDYAFLTRQWNQIRELTLSSTAPAPVYEESGPIKRAIRDLLTNDTDEILIEGESGYKEAREYMDVLMPERIKSVKLYKSKMPLFSRYQVENYLSSMFNPVVQLKSGGYLVIGVTEALVAIDVNSGRSTKEASIEDTALKTNLEAAEEVAKQLKLRDLAGLIVIDFIDMEQYRHKNEVENKLKDCLRKDRARIQVGRISPFGLLEMSRQRLRTGLVEAITTPCPHCHGTGITRSDDTIALSVIRAIEEEIAHGRTNEINAHVSPAIANYLFNEKRDYLFNFLDQYGVLVRVSADPTLHSNDFQIEKIKNPARPLPKSETVSADSVIEQSQSEDESENQNNSNRRRRRRGGRGRKKDQNGNQEASSAPNTDETDAQAANENENGGKDKKETSKSRKSSKSKAQKSKPDATEGDAVSSDEEAKPKSRRRSKSSKADAQAKNSEATDAKAENPAAAADAKSDEKPKRKRRTKAEIEADKLAKESGEPEDAPKKTRAKKSASKDADETAVESADVKPKRTRKTKAKAESEGDTNAAANDAIQPESNDAAKKPKRTGWWSG